MKLALDGEESWGCCLLACDNSPMAIQTPPTKIAGDNLHYGPGTRRFRGDTTGPARQTPPIKPGAQTNRAATAQRGSVDPSTNARTIARDEQLDPVYYGRGD